MKSYSCLFLNFFVFLLLGSVIGAEVGVEGVEMWIWIFWWVILLMVWPLDSSLISSLFLSFVFIYFFLFSFFKWISWWTQTWSWNFIGWDMVRSTTSFFNPKQACNMISESRFHSCRFPGLRVVLQETPVVTTRNPIKVRKFPKNWIFDGCRWVWMNEKWRSWKIWNEWRKNGVFHGLLPSKLGVHYFLENL